MTPFLWNGSKKDLFKDDLYKVLAEDESQFLGNQLESEWNKELDYRVQASKKEATYNPRSGFSAQYFFLVRYALCSEYLQQKHIFILCPTIEKKLNTEI